MDKVSTQQSHKTSVSLRKASYRRLQAGQKILARNKRILSEQELIRQLLAIYTKTWRGKGPKSQTARRYNVKGMGYVRRAAYFNHAFYAILWQRGTHTGESISRMLDFAIRNYLPQLIEQLLAVLPLARHVTKNSGYWRERHCTRFGRKKAVRSGFLTYASNTIENFQANMQWDQKATFHSLPYTPIPLTSPRSPYFYLDLTR